MHFDTDLDEFIQDEEPTPCPNCGAETNSQDCDLCGGEGFREYIESPDEWGEDCPSEVNHLITCRKCSGTGLQRWCPRCRADYWLAEQHKRKLERKANHG